MIPLLANIPARLKTLTDRLTAARASNLDNIDSTTMGRLDVAVSTVGKVRKTQVFTSSGTWPKPDGVDSVRVILVAGGAGGGSVDANTVNRCGGGGGGGQVIERDLAVTDDITVTIGAGGAGGTSGTVGSNGGNSTLTVGASLTAYGGTGGGVGSSTSTDRDGVDGNGNTGGAGVYLSTGVGGNGAGAGGSPETLATTSSGGVGGVPTYGYRGGFAFIPSNLYGMLHPGPGLCGYGGGGTGGSRYPLTDATNGAFLTTAVDGGGSGAAGTAGAGGDAVANTGGGGGGAFSSTATQYDGGDGADGICIITWFE